MNGGFGTRISRKEGEEKKRDGERSDEEDTHIPAHKNTFFYQ